MLFRELNEIKNWEIISEIVANKLEIHYPEIYKRSTNHSLIYLPIDIVQSIMPKLSHIFLPLNINIKNIALFVMYSDEHGILHSDNVVENYRINIPVINCEGSKTEYYEVSDSIYYQNSFYKIKLPAPESKIKFLDQFELTCPTVMSVNNFHKILLGKNVPRISLTISFYEDISFLLL